MRLVVAQADVVEWAVLPGRREFFVGHRTGPFVLFVSVFDGGSLTPLTALDGGATATTEAPIALTTRAFAFRAILLRRTVEFQGLPSNPSAATPSPLKTTHSRILAAGARVGRARVEHPGERRQERHDDVRRRSTGGSDDGRRRIRLR